MINEDSCFFLVLQYTPPPSTPPPTKTRVLSHFCQGKRNGNYANPKNCSGYITCDTGFTVFMNCPSGLWYNETIDRCDHPQNVQCQGKSLMRQKKNESKGRTIHHVLLSVLF